MAMGDFRHDVNPENPPTLLGLRDTLLGYGLTMGSLVCPPITYKMPSRRAGVLVMMLNAAAIQKLGPFIAMTIEQLRGKQNPKSVIVIDPRIPVTEYFVEMERVGLFFAWYKHHETGSLMACFSGSPADGGIITPEFCDTLTKLGCPTSLK